MTEKQRVHIIRLAELRRGSKCPWVNKNRKQSEETKAKIGLKNRGKLKGKKRSADSVKKGADKIRSGAYFNCLFCDKSFWAIPANIKKGHNKFCSVACYQAWQRGKSKISGFKLKPLVGEENPNWRGGITDESISIRNSNEYKEWRVAVFERDNYTCQHCGRKCGNGYDVYLEAHHLKSFSEYRDLRFDVNNGLTLCKECHEKTKVRINGKYRVA